MDHNYYVYIITNNRNTVLYIGITNDIKRRMYEHKNKIVRGFTSKYDLHKLVYFQQFTKPIEAIEYEKKLKGYLRIGKEKLIFEFNPKWEDLSTKFS